MTSKSSAIESRPRSSGTLRQRRERLPWPPNREFRILSIDGGGIRGVFATAFLAGLEERYLGGRAITRYFDLVAGTSTGGIVALGLGAGLTATELHDLYIHRGYDVFPPLPRILEPAAGVSQFFKYRYDRNALEKMLSDTFGERRFGESITRLCVPSCDGAHGEVYIFKTPHHKDYRCDLKEYMIKVGLATSAAPTYFKPLDDGGYTFVDGGVWCNNPIMVGLVDVFACFLVDSCRIRILSIGSGDNPYRVGKIRKVMGGKLFWYDIINAAMNFQSQNAYGQAGLLIGRDRIERIEPLMIGKPIRLDDWKRASNELPPAAAKLLEVRGEDIATQFLQEPTIPYDPVYATPANYHSKTRPDTRGA